MDITYLGHSSFKIKGKKTSVIVDPFDPKMVGLKFPKQEADIVTVSHDHGDHNATSLVGGNPFVIRGPGEYEVLGVGIIGVSTFHDEVQGKERGKNTIYVFDIDNVHIAHLGDLGEFPSEKIFDQLGSVDILMVPVGGTYTITAKQSLDVIKEIEPSVVIPMHYRRDEMDEKTFGTMTDLPHFFKTLGIEPVAPVAKYSVTRDKLPEQMQVVVFE